MNYLIKKSRGCGAPERWLNQDILGRDEGRMGNRPPPVTRDGDPVMPSLTWELWSFSVVTDFVLVGK